MFRVLVVASVVMVGCKPSAWRGQSSFFASATEGGPPGPGETLRTDVWSVDLAHQTLTSGELPQRALSDDDVKRLEDVLFDFKPVSSPRGCVADGAVYELSTDDTRYVESQNFCTNRGDDVVWVGTLSHVFDALGALSR